jgi:hypothetical protein
MRDDVYVRDEKVEMILVWTKYSMSEKDIFFTDKFRKDSFADC